VLKQKRSPNKETLVMMISQKGASFKGKVKTEAVVGRLSMWRSSASRCRNRVKKGPFWW
jgi:hypothetical protein